MTSWGRPGSPTERDGMSPRARAADRGEPVRITRLEVQRGPDSEREDREDHPRDRLDERNPFAPASASRFFSSRNAENTISPPPTSSISVHHGWKLARSTVQK